MPKWVAQGVTHEETVGTERSKMYPLLVCSNHPRWSVHSQHDDITWPREIKTCKVTGPDGYQYHPIWLHPSEAEKRGIKDGDVVNIFNDRGVVLAGAYITERIMPGVTTSTTAPSGTRSSRRDRPRRRHQHHRARAVPPPRTPSVTP